MSYGVYSGISSTLKPYPTIVTAHLEHSETELSCGIRYLAFLDWWLMQQTVSTLVFILSDLFNIRDLIDDVDELLMGD
jgi:hypothetical protein